MKYYVVWRALQQKAEESCILIHDFVSSTLYRWLLRMMLTTLLKSCALYVETMTVHTGGDIIVGWEIQLGSLGFFAEGAGIGLLKRISRTPPNQMKHPPMNPVEESCQEFPGASSADDVIDDASESNWSHTHASGIHVDGRIILNLWRLMRAEIKLNNYSLEAVADEVLRKVPLVPTKILNRWFATGPGRGRYRCIEYVNN
ncbi:hypothetical protein DAI22_07g070800 [Oryza sativa Japonica Group]|nr:hypothetical protein DAI22_07g070800 [Oryza sativa Japonica Group]KAF2921920.1 hypothetical protein DAI22_07g070800 [Oryza sativa Japonica Group]